MIKWHRGEITYDYCGDLVFCELEQRLILKIHCAITENQCRLARLLFVQVEILCSASTFNLMC